MYLFIVMGYSLQYMWLIGPDQTMVDNIPISLSLAYLISSPMVLHIIEHRFLWIIVTELSWTIPESYSWSLILFGSPLANIPLLPSSTSWLTPRGHSYPFRLILKFSSLFLGSKTKPWYLPQIFFLELLLREQGPPSSHDAASAVGAGAAWWNDVSVDLFLVSWWVPEGDSE